MVRESEPGRSRGQGRSQGIDQGQGRGYFNKRSSSSSYKQEEVKFVTTLRKQVYTYKAVKGVIFQKVQRSYGYEVKVSLRDI